PLSARLWQSTSPRDGLRGSVRQSQSIGHVPCGGQDLESPSHLVAPLSVRPWHAILSPWSRSGHFLSPAILPHRESWFDLPPPRQLRREWEIHRLFEESGPHRS